MNTEVIAPQTTAKTARFTVRNAPARLVANGLAGAETVSVSAVDGNPKVVTALSDGAGNALELTVTDPGIGLLFPGTYEVEKGVTAGDVSVYVSQS